jgi:membrane-bound serine protease (ClpP class)
MGGSAGNTVESGSVSIPVRALSLLLFFLFLYAALSGPAFSAAESPKRVYVIPVEGTVDPSLAAFVRRALKETGGEEDALYVFEMSTFGGRVDSALQIVETLLNEPKGTTVAFVKDKAISAGALIALACNKLVMRPNTTIGDCAPITYSEEGPKVMGEKFQSPLRAKFRTLARRNDYPPALAESMVTAEMMVYKVVSPDGTVYMDSQEYEDLTEAEKNRISARTTVVAEGELLTMDDMEARELGFSSMSAGSLDEMLAEMGIERYEEIRFEQNWSENLGKLIGSLSPFLLMIGLAAIYTELKAPGVGLPGIVGVICLALVFGNQYMVGLADYTELILVLLGFVLLAMELFVIPGFGIAGIAGILCIGVGVILSFQGFVLPDPEFPWEGELLIRNIAQTLGSFVVAIISSLLFLRYVLPRMGTVVAGPYLATTLREAHADSHQALKVKVGDEGTAITALRPSGKARLGEEYVDVITEGDFLAPGASIIVSAIKGNRVIVLQKDGKRR